MAAVPPSAKASLILLPGMLGTVDSDWAPHFDAIRESGFTPHGIDWHGHCAGQPLPDSMTLRNMVEHVVMECERLERETVLVWGYDLGGYVALELERQHPGRLAGFWMHATKFYWDDRSVERLRAALEPSTIDSGLQEALVKRFGKRWRSLLRLNRALLDDLLEFGPAEDDLAAVRAPVLVTAGDQDEWVTAAEVERLADRLVLGEFSIFSGVRHALHSARSSLIIPAAAEFSRRVLA